MPRFNVLALLCLGLLASCGPDSRGQASPAGTTVTRAVTAMASNLVLDANPLAFGDVRVDTQSTRTLTLSNKGTDPVTLTRVSIETGAPFSLVNPPALPFTLPAGTEQVLTVRFSPTAPGATSTTLTLTTDDPDLPTVTASLSGTGVSAPEWKLDRGSIFFGDVRVGTVSGKVPVTVSNTGTFEATLRSLSVQGPFAAIPPTGVTLPRAIPAGGSFTFDVIFKPSTEGAATGAVSLLGDTDSTLTVSLAGTGTSAAIHLSRTSLDFGKQRVKATSAALLVLISNPGSAELEITGFSVSHPAFALSAPLPLPSPDSPLRIAPGQQKSVAVSFTPTLPGVESGKLHIVSNASTSAMPVELTGEGVDGQPGLTPGAVTFSAVEVGTGGSRQSVVLANTGGHPLTLTRVIQPLETPFTITGLTAGLVLKPGEQVAFTATFTPVKRGHLSSTLVIETDSQLTPPLKLALSGTGVGPAVESQPGDIHFGTSNVGVPTSQNLSIKNGGERDLSVSNISFADAPLGVAGAALDFSVGGTVTFPLRVAPGESLLVPLKFTPRAVGPRQARALLYTNDRNAEVGLQGEGSSPNLALSVLNLDFGNVGVGSPSAPRPLKLSNTGSGPLTLHAMTLGGADVTAFVLTKPALPLLLQPGATTDIWVSLKPDAERRFTAQLVMESNDPDAPSVAVPLSGSGVRKQLQLSESSLKFGQQLLKNSSRPRKVHVTNNSDTNATLTALTVAGAGASQFTLAPLALPLLLAPGQGQEVAVSFTPQAEAEVTGTLKLTFSELPQPLEVALQGKGIPAVLSLKPSPLDFGGVRVGDGKREQPLTLTNLSSDPIVLAAPEVASQLGTPFSHDVATLQGRTLEPGMSVILTVGYQPTAENLSETRLSFGTTQPNEPRAVEVQLKARGLKQLLFVDPGSLNFGRVEVDKPQAPKVVTLVNRSAQPQWVVVKLKELEGSAFTVEAKALAEPIPAGGSATIKVAFQPLAEGEVQNEVQVWLKGETMAETLIPVIGSGHIPADTGGCASGGTEVGSSGLMALLMLVGLGSRRRRRA